MKNHHISYVQVELQGPQPDEHQSSVEDSASDSYSSDDSVNSISSASSENQDSFDVEVSSEDEVDAIPLPQDNSFLNDQIENGNQNPGYSVCWDDVQKLSVTRHHLRQDNKMMLWALCFAAKNRISFRHLDDVDDNCSTIHPGLEKSSETNGMCCPEYSSEKLPSVQ